MDGRSLNFCSVEKRRLRAKSPEIERDSYNVRAEELGVGGGWCRTKRQDPLPSRVMLLWPRHSECQSRKTQRVLSWHGWCSSDVGYSLPPHSRTAQLLYNQNNTSETIIALMTTSQIFYFFSRNWMYDASDLRYMDHSDPQIDTRTVLIKMQVNAVIGR